MSKDIKYERKIRKKITFKGELKKVLSEEELTRIKTAFDIVGDVAILEMDEEFYPKEKEIGDALLVVHNNLNTILRKDGDHEGVFRTQKMKCIAGVDTTIATYKENNTLMKIDVEQVYFSARLSTERKRIMQLVKPGEEVMELFSGCAPYALVLSKNTKVKEIQGIEINPVGHLLGIENIKINKFNNIKLFCGDVKKLVPNINNLNIGLKGSYKNFDSIYFEGLQIFELQVESDELDNDYDNISYFIDKLAEKGIRVMIHHVFKYKKQRVGLGVYEFNTTEEMIRKFLELSKKSNVIGFGMHISDGTLHGTHPHKLDKNDSKKIELLNNAVRNINYLFKKYKKEKIQDKMYFENNFYDFYSLDDMMFLQRKTGIKNLNFDLVHLFLSHIYSKQYCDNTDIKKIDMDKYRKLIEQIKEKFNVYFHIGDTDGQFPESDDSIEIGTGLIDYSKIIDLIDFGVIEVWDYYSNEYTENKKSYEYFCNLRNKVLGKKTFDRILMPLPKSAEEFLPDALVLAKKGSIIHFYDFLNEKEFYLAEEKVKKATELSGVKYKVLDFVKCGQFSPGTFRVCLDIQIE